MHIIKQKGYDEFTCIMEQCPESCCKFWQIFSDKSSFERYCTLARTDERVRKNLNRKDASFCQEDGKCGFLDPDELCYLQKTYGEDALCDTCRLFPRHMEEFENVREYSLSLACPHAAEELIRQTQPVGFEEAEDAEEEFYEDFDCLLYDRLLYEREIIFRIATCKKLPLFERLRQICDHAKKLQELLDNGKLFEIESYETGSESVEKAEDPFFNSSVGDRETYDWENEKRQFSVLFELETLHKDWTEKLDKAWKIFFSGKRIAETDRAFSSFVNKAESAGERILVQLLFTYFCGAVYDGWIYSKAALAAYSVKWIFYLAFSEGGTTEDLIRTTYQYAREIENSDLNLDALEEWFMK